jgi:hypothetical protein
VNAQESAAQKAAAANAEKIGPTSQQLERQQAASKDQNLRASVNKGNPNADAIKSFNKGEGAGQGKGAQELGAAAGPGQGENKPGNVSEHRGKKAGDAGQHGNKHGAENQHDRRNVGGNQAKARSGKTAKHEGSARGPHEMTQKSRHPQMGAAGPKGGGKHPQAGGNRGPATEQQKGKKKEGKPEKQHGRY